MVFSRATVCMDSIDFDFLANNDDGNDMDQGSDDDLIALWATPDRDPRVVRSIGDVADNAEAHLASRQARNNDEVELDFDILSLHESELECLWPTWGERRVASLGRGIPLGLTITPQYLPKGNGGKARPTNYSGGFIKPATR